MIENEASNDLAEVKRVGEEKNGELSKLSKETEINITDRLNYGEMSNSVQDMQDLHEKTRQLAKNRSKPALEESLRGRP